MARTANSRQKSGGAKKIRRSQRPSENQAAVIHAQGESLRECVCVCVCVCVCACVHACVQVHAHKYMYVLQCKVCVHLPTSLCTQLNHGHV